jgi:hypothetical protein
MANDMAVAISATQLAMKRRRWFMAMRGAPCV